MLTIQIWVALEVGIEEQRKRDRTFIFPQIILGSLDLWGLVASCDELSCLIIFLL